MISCHIMDAFIFAVLMHLHDRTDVTNCTSKNKNPFIALNFSE